MSRRGDIHARYSHGVEPRAVNREAWARIVADLIHEKTGGKKATFAKRIPVDPRTVARWLARQSEVTEVNVREVARTFGLSPVQMLVEVGFYTADEFGEAAVLAEVADPEERRILDLDIDPQQKVALIERLRDLQEADRLRREGLIDRWAERLHKDP